MARETPLMIVDSAGVVVQWSRQAAELMRREADEVVGRPATDLVIRPVSSSGGGAEPQCGRFDLEDVVGGPAGVDLRVQPLLRHDGSVAWGIFQGPEERTTPSGMRAAALEALLTYAPGGLLILDAQLRIVSANSIARELCDAGSEGPQGRHITEVWRLSSPGDVESMLREVLATGAPAPERVVRAYPRDDSRPPYMAGISAYPLRDSQGAVVVVTDVTDREKTRGRLRTLGAVRERVGRTLDVVATCQELVEALVPGFADMAVVEVVEPVVRGEEPPLSPLGRGVPLRRAALRHGGGEQQTQAHPVGDVRALPFPTPYAQALADLKPRAVILGPDTPGLAADPARAEAIRASGARALLSAPLTLRGTVLGLLSLYRTRQDDAFDEKEVALTLALATHAALSIDNARRYIREHTIAAALQRHLLSPSPPSQTAVETAHLYVPCEQGGGGWFDALCLPGARTGLVIGDASGRGIHPASTMGQLRTVVCSLAALDLEPDELLARLDDTATRLARERAALPSGDPLHREPLSASCLYAIYDPFTRGCTIASAGHPSPVIARPDGTTDVLDLPTGPTLGSGAEAPFAATTVTLADGSLLALYTSSLLSTSSPGAKGDPEVLKQVLASPGRPLQDLCDDVLYRVEADSLIGDAMLLLARTRTFPADHVGTWHLDHDPAAAAAARRHTRHQLSAWGVDEETAYTTEMIVSELVTNAVRYGAPPVELRLIRDRTLTCEVHDTSATAPHLRHARTVDEGGRGLFICAQLSQNWGVRYTADGKTVWSEQALSPSPR
ncbi:SpoIIE family protein phosphatase [Streptomyces sp. NPDC008222]|uniref:SpoIIE family protein phosphatase n=1 Tax=Streptomyces sp. NPDC008222 TaxID=3364820 RepID=UPI0036E8513B